MKAAIASKPAPAIAPFDDKQARAHQEAWAKHLGTTVETTNSVGAKMILIPPGEFLMGSTEEQIAKALKMAAETGTDQKTTDRISKSESPQHRVIVATPLRMEATEVTVGEFAKFVAATGYKTEAEQNGDAPNKSQPTPLRPGFDVTLDTPAVWINWRDAMVYCRWLSDQEKTTYRLATEAEWEYACRAGTTTPWFWGENDVEFPEFAWCNSNEKPERVGQLKPNAWGLYDMLGNVNEWCADKGTRYQAASTTDPLNAFNALPAQSFRGGSRAVPVHQCRSASRGEYPADFRGGHFGFRVAVMIDTANLRATKVDSISIDPGQ